jgi:hypothetical protein
MYKPKELMWKRRNRSQTSIYSAPVPTLEFVVELINDEYRCLLPLNDQMARGIKATFKDPDDARMFCHCYWLSEYRRLIEQKINNLNRQSPSPIKEMQYYQNLLV